MNKVMYCLVQTILILILVFYLLIELIKLGYIDSGSWDGVFLPTSFLAILLLLFHLFPSSIETLTVIKVLKSFYFGILSFFSALKFLLDGIDP